MQLVAILDVLLLAMAESVHAHADPRGTASGQVLSVLGVPLAATVSLESDAMDVAGRRADTDGEGRFRLGAPDRIDPLARLVVRARGYQTVAIGHLTLTPLGHVDVGTIVMQSGLALRGRIVDASGRGVANARVLVRRERDLECERAAAETFELALTGSNGEYAFDSLAPRRHRLVALPLTPFTPRVEASVSPGDAVQTTVVDTVPIAEEVAAARAITDRSPAPSSPPARVAGTRSFRGVVRTSDGVTVADAIVALDSVTTRTDGDGRFEFENAPKEAAIAVDAGALGTYHTAGVLPEQLAIQLVRSGAVHVTLCEQPAREWITIHLGYGEGFHQSHVTMRGEHTFEHVPPGTYFVWASCPGRLELARTRVEVRSGTTLDVALDTSAMTPCARLEGRITINGRPAAFRRISLERALANRQGPNTVHGEAITDGDGRYTFAIGDRQPAWIRELDQRLDRGRLIVDALPHALDARFDQAGGIARRDMSWEPAQVQRVDLDLTTALVTVLAERTDGREVAMRPIVQPDGEAGPFIRPRGRGASDRQAAELFGNRYTFELATGAYRLRAYARPEASAERAFIVASAEPVTIELVW